MNDFVKDFESRYETPSRDEIDRLIAEAHKLRQETMRDALTSFWAMVRRNIGYEAVAPAARHV